MISPEMVGPMIGMVLMDPEQRSAVETQIIGYFAGRSVFCMALGDETGAVTHKFQTPEEIATAFVGILAGELGIDLPGYRNVLNPGDNPEQS